MGFYVRLMRPEDIAQVTRIDHDAFPTMWPPTNFKHELENSMAHYLVVVEEGKRYEEPPRPQLSGLSAWLNRIFDHGRFFGTKLPPPGSEFIAGFAGFWIMAGEAHIVSIAVREEYRCRGIGELLLGKLVEMAIELNSSLVTLEVRASNKSAQNLYQKFGFVPVGVRKAYYTDNKEDGIVMTVDKVESPDYNRRLDSLLQENNRRGNNIKT